MPDVIKNFPGSASLPETQQSCEETQRRKRVQLTKIELGKAKIDGKDTNVNIITFKDMRTNEDEILKKLIFIDVSTVQGMSDAASQKGKELFAGKMFISDEIKDVKVFGEKRVVP